MVTVFLVTAILSSGCSAIRESVGEGGYQAESPMVDSVEYEKSMVAEESMEMMAPEEDYYAEETVADAGNSDYTSTPEISGKVIKTAWLEIEVEEGKFEEVFFAISGLANTNGGFVASSNTYSDDDGNPTSGNVIIRIEQNNFDGVISKIKALGTVRSIQLGGEDVTQEYVDLESRLRNLNAQEEILLDLMGQSESVSDSIEVQRELNYVQEEIEIVKGRMNYLDNMVSYSTINVYLQEPVPITPSSGNGFLDAIKRGARGALTVIKGIILVFIVSAPILAVIGIILLIIWLSLRARNRRRAAKASERNK